MLRQADGNTDNGGCCQCVEHARNAFFLLLYLLENRLQCLTVSCVHHLGISVTCQSHRNERKLDTFLGSAMLKTKLFNGYIQMITLIVREES